MTIKAQALTMLALAGPLLSLQAQTNKTATAATTATTSAATNIVSSFEQTIQNIKHPVSWMSWGADLRARNEYFYDLLTLNPNNRLHEQDYFRFRTRIWTSISPIDDLSLNARLATEPREWLELAGYTPQKGRSGFDWTEGIIDNLNIQWRNILQQPLTATVGRQDIFLGDGWLVGDGTPFDGSWTYFLDAARVTYELKDQHTTIDAIGIIQDGKDNGWLPPINFQDRYLTEQNEKGAILNVVNSSLPYANLNGYFIYKHDQKLSGYSPANPAPAGGDNADIYTIGGRVSGLAAEHWKYSAEGAYQFGERQDASIKFPSVSTAFRDVSAFGFNGRATYLFKDKLNNQLGLAYEFLSGDDPNTQGYEAFDLLWGRWPYWSEIGLYSYAAESRIGQEVNLHRIGPTWSISPLKKLQFDASYFALIAPQEVATQGATGLFSNNGNFRGHFIQTILRYKFNQHISAHLWGELLFPGDYYVNKDLISFARVEVMLAF